MKPNTQIQAIEVVPVLTKEYAPECLIRLFKALDIVNKISEGIEADPVAAKKMFTPENVQNVMALKRKIDAGTIKPSDIESAFPAIKDFPLWPMLKAMFK